MIDKTYMETAPYIHIYTVFTPNLACVCGVPMKLAHFIYVTGVLHELFYVIITSLI
jgi:hypothetical protein